MPVISQQAGHVTQINHIKVDPRHQDALVARMAEQLERNMATQPDSSHRPFIAAKTGGTS